MGKEKSSNSTLQNVFYILKAMVQRYPSTKVEVPVLVLARIISPLLDTVFPAAAVEFIMRQDMKGFVLVLSALLVLKQASLLLGNYTEQMVGGHAIHTRVGTFMYRLIHKSISCDYQNVEPHKKQRAICAAASAVDGSYLGTETMINQSIELLTSFLGLFTFGTTIFLLDRTVMLITVALVIGDVLFRIHAINYNERHRAENNDVYRKRNYAKRSSLDVKSGKDIRVYEMEHWFSGIFDDLIKAAVKYEKKIHLRWYFPTLFDQIVVGPRDILANFILITQVLTDEITIAEYTLYLGLIAGFSNWIYGIAGQMSALSGCSHVFNDYRKVMAMSDSFHHKEGEIVDSYFPITIEFCDVSFRYEDADVDTLSHVSFKIQPGEKIALVGNNGAGKTTIVKLLCGLYQPTAGRILINGHDIKNLDIEEYQSLLGVLFQDTELLAFPIAVNVSGKDASETDMNRVRESLKKVGLWDRISQLEQKENTYITQVLDEKGILLSGGETQKLLLARALYKDSSMMILDEPTAALDPIAESKMYEEYNNMTKGKTSIFISHRLASTKFCNRIIYLEKGQIMEQGSHTELISIGGRYKEIYDIQSHYYQDKVVNTDEA